MQSRPTTSHLTAYMSRPITGNRGGSQSLRRPFTGISRPMTGKTNYTAVNDSNRNTSQRHWVPPFVKSKYPL